MLDRHLLTLAKSLGFVILAGSLLLSTQAKSIPTIDNNPATIESVSRRGVLTLLVVDQTSKPISNQPTKIQSDNGIRCITAPCPTNNKNWQGKIDRQGLLLIPRAVIQAYTTMTVRGYLPVDLVKNMRKNPRGESFVMIIPASPQ